MASAKYEKLKFSPSSGTYGNNYGDSLSNFTQPSVDDPLLKEAEAILHGDRKLSWNSLPNAIISKAEAAQLSELVNADHPNIQDTMIRQNGVVYVDIFLKMLKVIEKIFIYLNKRSNIRILNLLFRYINIFLTSYLLCFNSPLILSKYLTFCSNTEYKQI